MSVAPEGTDTAEAPPSVAHALQRLLQSVVAQVVGIADLAAMEARLAAMTIVEMVALALGAALFAITAWWLLLAAVTAYLITVGMSLSLETLLARSADAI